MTVRVALDEVAGAVAERGGVGFLLTAGGDATVHATHVVVAADAHALRAPAGRRSCENASRAGVVTLLLPSRGADDMSLLVDGTAVVEGVLGEGAVVVVTPTSAMLHRRPDQEPC